MSGEVDLQQLIIDLSDALSDEGPDWSEEGLLALRRRVAAAVRREQLPDWLRRYRGADVVTLSR